MQRGGLRELAAISGTPKEPSSSMAQPAPKRLKGGGPTRGGGTTGIGAAPPWGGPQTPNEKVHAVIDKQDFDGWWEHSRELMDIIGTQGIDAKKGKEWVTMLV
ncbi:MAG: hypothetical protein Q9174_001263, partial [Haloplaca sp. 1 TL-2023]